MDKDDLCGKALRANYVFKLIPMLNPDGVYRGHFRMDQYGHNLNRYYNTPDASTQPSIFAAKSLLDHYAKQQTLSVYLDFHAHASKRGCFIYGNVLDSIEDQVQNQLFCKLIAMNTPHFDYEGCLFSREHMFRIDPGDQAKGLTAEGSGRVATYLAYGLIHSYTIECNYNTSRIGNEVPPPEQEIGGQYVTPASAFTTNPEKYTPSTYAGVGRACVVALLDLKGQNPASRISKSKFKTLERIRNAVVLEVRSRKEYFGKKMDKERRRSVSQDGVGKRIINNTSSSSSLPTYCQDNSDFPWKRVIDSSETSNSNQNCSNSTPLSARSNSASSRTNPNNSGHNSQGVTPPPSSSSSSSSSSVCDKPVGVSRSGQPLPPSEILFISAKSNPTKRRASSLPSSNQPSSSSDLLPVKTVIEESSQSNKYVLSNSSPLSLHKKLQPSLASQQLPSLRLSPDILGSQSRSPRYLPDSRAESLDSSESSDYYSNSSRDSLQNLKGEEGPFQRGIDRSNSSDSVTSTTAVRHGVMTRSCDDGSLADPHQQQRDGSRSPSYYNSFHSCSNSGKYSSSHPIPPRGNGGVLPGGIAFVKTKSNEDIAVSLLLDDNYNNGTGSPAEMMGTPGSYNSKGGNTVNSRSPSSPSLPLSAVAPLPMPSSSGLSGPIHANGTTMRDLVKEHSINKFSKLSVNSSGNNNSNSNTFSAANQPLTKKHSNKDNRKILGKTLHAAGVALLISGSPSSSSLAAVPSSSNINSGNTEQQATRKMSQSHSHPQSLSPTFDLPPITNSAAGHNSGHNPTFQSISDSTAFHHKERNIHSGSSASKDIHSTVPKPPSHPPSSSTAAQMHYRNTNDSPVLIVTGSHSTVNRSRSSTPQNHQSRADGSSNHDQFEIVH
jgi:hypothetical protein